MTALVEPNLLERFISWCGHYGILAAFFALSGFLISGSAERLSLGNFIVNRGLRIVPALALEITLAVFVLGPIFTNLPLSEYFTTGKTWKYFTNIVGFVNFFLPGVFTHNPDGQVNISLWTVPHEIGCYMLMTALIILHLLKRPASVVATYLVFVVIGIALVGLGFETGGPDRLFYARGSGLYAGFLLGIALWLYRYRIPYHPGLAILAVCVCAVMALVGDPNYPNYPVLNLINGPCLVYLTIFIGVSNVPTPRIMRRGDYSYGIYLYGYPIQQTVKAAFTGINSVPLLFLVSMAFIVPFAALSWHMVEKPILKLRRRFSFMARVREAEEALTMAGKATRLDTSTTDPVRPG